MNRSRTFALKLMARAAERGVLPCDVAETAYPNDPEQASDFEAQILRIMSGRASEYELVVFERVLIAGMGN